MALNATMKALSDYRPDIDGLRAIAVLAVLLFHFDFVSMPGGFVGVDIFFVISGFLITGIITREIGEGKFTFANFYLRRVRRILPALFVVIIVTLIGAGVLFTPADYERLGRVGLATLFFGSNLFFWREAGYFDVASFVKPLLHTWSLAVEEQFYFIWPGSLAILLALRRSWAVPTFIAIAGLASLALSIWYPGAPGTMFYLLPFRLHEFAIGAGLVYVVRHAPRGAWADLTMIVGLALIAAAIVFFSGSLPFPSFYALVPCLGAALVIFSRGGDRLAYALANPLIVAIGKISYSLYLVHWPLYVAYRYQVGPAQIEPREQFVLLGLSFGLAILSYHFVEQPFRQRRVRLRWLAALAAVVGLLSALLIGSTGVPARLSWIKGVEISLEQPVYGGELCVPRCESNPGATKTVYVIGDSHARAYYAGLIDVFPEVNFIVFEYGGCEFYSDRYYGDTMVDVDTCLRLRQEAWAEIDGTTDPVIIGQHWYANFTETQISREDLPPLLFTSYAPYASFVADELQRLRAHVSGRLIVLGGVPKYTLYTGAYAVSPYACQTMPLMGADCAMTPQAGSVQIQHTQINALLAADLGPGFEFVDPFDFLCTAGECRNLDDNNQPIYSDGAHLSMQGSVFAVRRMRETLAFN